MNEYYEDFGKILMTIIILALVIYIGSGIVSQIIGSGWESSCPIIARILTSHIRPSPRWWAVRAVLAQII